MTDDDLERLATHLRRLKAWRVFKQLAPDRAPAPPPYPDKLLSEVVSDFATDEVQEAHCREISAGRDDIGSMYRTRLAWVRAYTALVPSIDDDPRVSVTNPDARAGLEDLRQWCRGVMAKVNAMARVDDGEAANAEGTELADAEPNDGPETEPIGIPAKLHPLLLAMLAAGPELRTARWLAERGVGDPGLSEKTVRKHLVDLVARGLAEKPEGERDGARLTSEGRRRAAGL